MTSTTKTDQTDTDSAKWLTAATFREYSEVLRRYLIMRVRRPEDAEDLAQEVFELLLRKRNRTETIHNPLAYLFRITFHVVGDALAKEKRSQVTFDSQLASQASEQDHGTTLEEELDVYQDISEALSKLPKNHLTALMMVESRGMSYEAVAKATGFAENTVAMYVSKARAALKLHLDAAWKERSRR